MVKPGAAPVRTCAAFCPGVRPCGLGARPGVRQPGPSLVGGGHSPPLELPRPLSRDWAPEVQECGAQHPSAVTYRRSVLCPGG